MNASAATKGFDRPYGSATPTAQSMSDTRKPFRLRCPQTREAWHFDSFDAALHMRTTIDEKAERVCKHARHTIEQRDGRGWRPVPTAVHPHMRSDVRADLYATMIANFARLSGSTKRADVKAREALRAEMLRYSASEQANGDKLIAEAHAGTSGKLPTREISWHRGWSFRLSDAANR